MGIKQVLLTGCDYGYPDRLFYANNTPLYEKYLNISTRINTSEKLFLEILKKRKLIIRKDYSNSELLTDIILEKYAAWTEDLKSQLGNQAEWYNMSSSSLKIPAALKIIISKANQDAKRKIMNVREKIIEECFSIAHQKLSVLKESEYEKTVTKLIENGKKKIEGQCSVTISREIDKQIAKNMGLRVTGEIESSGGIILISSDGRITLDNTFDGILKRKKNEIRIEVGKLLFSE